MFAIDKYVIKLFEASDFFFFLTLIIFINNNHRFFATISTNILPDILPALYIPAPILWMQAIGR